MSGVERGNPAEGGNAAVEGYALSWDVCHAVEGYALSWDVCEIDICKGGVLLLMTARWHDSHTVNVNIQQTSGKLAK